MPDPGQNKKSIFHLLTNTWQQFFPQQKRNFRKAIWFAFFLMMLDFVGIAILIRMVWAIAGVETNRINFEIIKFHVSELHLMGILALLFILKSIISLLIFRKMQIAQFQISHDLVFNRTHWLLNEGVNFEQTDASKEVNQLFNVAFFFPDIILTSVVQIFTEVMMTLAMIMLAVYLSSNYLILILLVMFPVIYFSFISIRKKLNSYGEEINQKIPVLFDAIQDHVHGNADIRLNRKGNYFEKRLSDLLRIVHRLRRKSAFTGTQLTFRVMESAVVLFLFALLLINRRLAGSEIVIAQISALGVIGFRMIPSLTRILASANHLNQYRFVLEGLSQNPLTKKDFPDHESFFFHHIELKDISFAYHAEQPILQNFNCRLEHGQILGISGKSGSGKSTLASLIAGLRIPDKGKIYINGESTDEYPVYNMIKVSMVQQEIHLLKGNLAQNISLTYDETWDPEKMNEALKLSALSEWVQKLPDGLETEVGEWGSLISGGQKQRLAIARALYHQADLMILDEATRALDLAAEKEILETVKSLAKKGTAVLIISHNKEVLSIADNIINLDKVS